MKYLQNIFCACYWCSCCEDAMQGGVPKAHLIWRQCYRTPQYTQLEAEQRRKPSKGRCRGNLGPLPEALPENSQDPHRTTSPPRAWHTPGSPPCSREVALRGLGLNHPPQLLSGQLISNKILFCLENNCSQSSAAAGCPSQPQPLNKALIM